MNVLKRRMENKLYYLLIILSCLFFNLKAQENPDAFSILFYNVENLFDTTNNPETEDDSFTPEGDMHWTSKRLDAKIKNISKVILSATGWSVPDLLVLCEIENKMVLEKLIHDSPLNRTKYKIIHKESPDHRGIDVALIYNSKIFTPLTYDYFPLTEKDNVLNTREIMYVSGILGNDTIHILGNHWPSRYGGLLETNEYRELAAKTLKNIVLQIQLQHISPKIVIVGDFNENPDSEILSKILGASETIGEVKTDGLYNLSNHWLKPDFGSLKYQSQWSVFDQIIVSGSILVATNGIGAKSENGRLVTLPFLFQKDEKYGGRKLFRTYYGFEYTGGFSDHLPVLLYLNQLD